MECWTGGKAANLPFDKLTALPVLVPALPFAVNYPPFIYSPRPAPSYQLRRTCRLLARFPASSKPARPAANCGCLICLREGLFLALDPCDSAFDRSRFFSLVNPPPQKKTRLALTPGHSSCQTSAAEGKQPPGYSTNHPLALFDRSLTLLEQEQPRSTTP